MINMLEVASVMAGSEARRRGGCWVMLGGYAAAQYLMSTDLICTVPGEIRAWGGTGPTRERYEIGLCWWLQKRGWRGDGGLGEGYGQVTVFFGGGF